MKVPCFPCTLGPANYIAGPGLRISSASRHLRDLRCQVDWLCPRTLVGPLKPGSLAAREDKNDLLHQQAACGTVCDKQHPFLWAYAHMHETCASPKYQLASPQWITRGLLCEPTAVYGLDQLACPDHLRGEQLF